MQTDELKRLLATCEEEQLHLSGAIQAHGTMLVADLPTLIVTHAAANCQAFIAAPAQAILGQPLSDCLPVPGLADRIRGLQRGRLLHLPLAYRHAERDLDLILSSNGEQVFCELEPSAGPPPAADLIPHLELSRAPENAVELAAYQQHIAEILQRLTGFARVLVYRFRDDGCGEVVAESIAEKRPRPEDAVSDAVSDTISDTASYLGLRFPASDIPQIARRIYLCTGHRHIPDNDSEPVPLLAQPGTGVADQSLTDLRSVSPVHLEYMHNMGVTASVTFSILINKQLWGLITCHHPRPRFLPFEVRTHGEGLVRTFALGMSTYSSSLHLGAMDRLEHRLDQLAQAFADSGVALRQALLIYSEQILALTEATGGALIDEMGIETFGQAPDQTAMLALDRYFQAENNDFIATSHLAGLWPEGHSLRSIASGAIMTRVKRRGANDTTRFYWFRPDQPQTVAWAGDPRKPIEFGATGQQRLSPRRSFAKWTEITTGHGDPWTLSDLMAAKRFRGMVLRWV